ncbi:hypothetical protein ACFQ49_14825 [Kroppenstedtia eburnea]|uniref:Uncharacterized protein n=2 Tax=Kroppenstedtia TaxID=1274351 RepID=A0ABW4CA76_9BACL|nr:hypothetical protein [Kroppenstedtia guangzhouensis]GGA50445.1 hypothetical protein GCM10007416_24490 [Kroppenstedtia guangzhouensis]
MREFFLQVLREGWALVKLVIPVIVAHHLQKTRKNTKKPGSPGRYRRNRAKRSKR